MLDELFSGEPYYVNVHAQKTGDAVPPGIACADVVATMPATGGPFSPLTALVVGGAVLLAIATAAGLRVRRRA